jgi:mono/diheme cytochrome c family protein
MKYNLTTKKFTLSAAIVVMALFSSCGNSGSDNANQTNAPQSMVTADDGQGVGKYKNDEFPTLDTVVATKGEALFKLKCSACHKPTDQKLVGPGLYGVTKRRKASWIMNMMTNPLEMTKNDPTAKGLLEKHLVQMTFQDVNDEQAHQIVMFFLKNDSK